MKKKGVFVVAAANLSFGFCHSAWEKKISSQAPATQSPPPPRKNTTMAKWKGATQFFQTATTKKNVFLTFQHHFG